MTSFLSVLKGETQLVDASIEKTSNNNSFMNNFFQVLKC